MHISRAFISTRLNAAVIAIGYSLGIAPAFAQESGLPLPSVQAGHDETRLDAPTPQSRQLELPASEEHNVKLKTYAIMLGETMGVAWYGKHKWWQEGFQGNFRKGDEAWFGQNTYAGGADKVGHLYTSYVASRLLTKAFTHVGNDPDHALFLGAALALGTMTAVEVLDGYAKSWRFSKEDAMMNLVGTGAGVLFEKCPGLDELLDLRLQYQRSRLESGSFDPVGDYSGQTYLMVLKASGIPGLRDSSWLRYVELAAGYGVRNYSALRPDRIDPRSRNVYFGISLNLSELLNRSVFKNSPDGSARGLANTVFEYVQVPGAAVLRSHQLPAH